MKTQASQYAFHGILLAGLAALLLAAPIGQPEGYHAFADSRGVGRVPNFTDVASNLPLLIAGLLGLYWCLKERIQRDWLCMFGGIALVGVGSAYYHWAPDDHSLFYDRLPMALAFAAFFAALVRERVNERLGRAALWPLVGFAAASVLWWQYSGDLSLYLWVQAAPLVAIGLVLVLFREHRDDRFYFCALAFYALAKAAELFDAALFELTGQVISGHSLKHLLAAVGVASLWRMLARRALPQHDGAFVWEMAGRIRM